MKFNASRSETGVFGVLIVLQLGLMVFAGSVPAAPATAELGSALEWVLRSSEVGGSIVRRLTGVTDLVVTEGTFKSFRERLKWENSKGLADELRTEGRKLEAELEEYRVSQSRPAKLAEGEALGPEDMEFLAQRANRLHSNKLENILIERLNFIDAYTGPRDKVPTNYRRNKEDVMDVSTQDGEVPARPDPVRLAFDPDATRKTRAMQLAWWNKMGIRFRASRKFVESLTLAEGDWRNLFIQSGKPFTQNDLATVRKYSRLLDTINDYSEMRLVIHAFSNEPKAAVDELMHAMADVPVKSIEKYIAIAREKGKDLPLNDVVYEGMRRMLNALERCHSLEVEIGRAEMNVWKYDDSISDAERLMAAAKGKGDMPEYRRHAGDRDLALQRRDKSARVLEDKSLEFVKNRDQLEIFVNLRSGLINSESVAPFDMAEAFTVSTAQIERWAPFYERAMGRSINALIKKEVTGTVKAQIGKTRTLVRDLNKLTKQVSGRSFTKTEAGKHLEEYAERHVTRVLIRMAKLVGITLGPVEALELAKHKMPAWLDQVKKIIGDFNGESTDDPSATPSVGKNAPAGTASSAPANPNTPPPVEDPVPPAGSGLPDNPFGSGNPFGN